MIDQSIYKMFDIKLSPKFDVTISEETLSDDLFRLFTLIQSSNSENVLKDKSQLNYEQLSGGIINGSFKISLPNGETVIVRVFLYKGIKFMCQEDIDWYDREFEIRMMHVLASKELFSEIIATQSTMAMYTNSFPAHV